MTHSDSVIIAEQALKAAKESGNLNAEKAAARILEEARLKEVQASALKLLNTKPA